MLLALFVVLLVSIVFVEQGQRPHPVQFASGGRPGACGGQSTYIPSRSTSRA
ncbi:MAG: hypothetical protein H6518_15050 [Microthrixaceae bacterium]|nr:hypothetical protein [Microthrixaceae bacterium]